MFNKVAARNVARTHQIWKHSPVVKVVPEALRAEAVKRMEARKVTGEKVKAIAADLNLSVGCLYKALQGHLTVSIGCVLLPRQSVTPNDFDALVHHADEMLYQAKNSGRNRLKHRELKTL